MNSHFVYSVNFGLTNYGKMWELQKHLHAARLKKEIPDVLIFTEHENVYTLGKSSNKNHLLANTDELTKKNVESYEIDRGGDVTYHGPGQLVCYPILNLSEYEEDIHKYLRNLEEVIIKTLSDFKIQSKRIPEFTGVWVNDEKIAAIGVKISRWITMHGFAFNVSTDLKYFDRIIPCGIFNKGVTSLKELGIETSMESVIESITNNFKEVFKMNVNKISKDKLNSLIQYSDAQTENLNQEIFL